MILITHPNHTPLVSILITVRNAEAYISDTLTSILQERQIPLEVVLVDNGCTDATIAKAIAFQDERIRVIEGPKKGIAHALNVAYAAARGEIIMRCDGDDLYPPERIQQQTKWLQEHPDYGAVCGGFSTIDPQGKHLATLGCEANKITEEITDELQNGVTRTHVGTYAFRATAVKAAGYSREYFDCFEDIDFQLRLGEACRVCYIPVDQYLYRLHPTSVTHSKSQAMMEFYDAMALTFQQQRRTTGMDDLQRDCPPPIPQFDTKTHTITEHVERMLLARSWQEHQDGHKKQAILTGCRLVANQVTNLQAWRNLVALVVKPSGRGLPLSRLNTPSSNRP